MLKIIKVTGNSLSPFFLPGDYVILSTNRSLFRTLKPDDTIVFEHPVFGQLIKRVLTNTPSTEVLNVSGTHENSISSRKLGPIPYSDILGKVMFQIKKPR